MINWTVRTRIVAAFATIVLLLGALGAVSFVKMSRIRTEASRLRADVLPGVLFSGAISGASKDLVAAVLAREAAHDAPSRVRAETAVTEAQRELDRAQGQYVGTVSSEDDRQLTNSLRAGVAQFSAAYKQATADGVVSQAELAGQLRPALDRVVQLGDSLVQLNSGNGERASAAILADVDSALRATIGTVGAVVLVALVFGWLLVQLIGEGFARLMSVTQVMRAGDFRQRVAIPRRDELGMLGDGINQMADDLTGLIGQVQQSGIQVNSSATEIAATSKQQQATATEIAATTSEVGATASRISATAKELVRTMDEVSAVADQTASLAEGGQTGLERMGSSMQQIGEASALINSRLALLSEKAANIGLVVTTINKVADQTNLLSLNAAIEAEKAGEHGRGFTVVAREIRRLADQTAGATSDIEQLVKEMQSAVSAGVMGMDKFSEEVRRGGEVIGQVTAQLSEIIDQVQTLTPSFDAVNEGMKSQSVGAEQISQALSQLSLASQQTADSLRQSNMAIEQLNEAARGLQSGVSRFTLAG